MEIESISIETERIEVKNISIVKEGRGRRIRIIVMSDIHSKEENLLNNLPKGDLLLISGDITQSGQLKEYKQFNLFIKEISQRDLYQSIVFIAGNHERTLDINYYNNYGWRYDKIPQNTKECREALFNELPSNVYYLCDSSIILYDLVIYGTPWVIGSDTFTSEFSSLEIPTNLEIYPNITEITQEVEIIEGTEISKLKLKEHFRWGFTLTEEELESKWTLIPSNVDILITHQPPFGAGDKRRNYDLDKIIDDKQIFGYENKGSKSLQSIYSRINPKLHVCGHEHNGYGAYKYINPYSNTIILNAAVCDEDYFPTHPLLVIDINSNQKQDIYYETIALNNKIISHHYQLDDMNLYIATLLSFDLNNIQLIEVEFEVLRTFLQLITSPVNIEIVSSNKISTILSYYAELHNQQKENVNQKLNTQILQVFHNIYHNLVSFTKREVFQIQKLIEKFQEIIFNILDKYSLLNNLYDYRRLSQAANIDNSNDFRSIQLVLPRIYLGPEYPAYNLEYLQQFGITHIINCCGIEPQFPNEIKYYMININDESSANIFQFFHPSIEFIKQALNHNNENKLSKILIHCQMGISRSATILVAYIMSELNVSFSIAHSIVKRARGFISINEGFINQLIEWDELNTNENKLIPFI